MLLNEIAKFKNNKVWKTKKCRMNAEERYLKYNTRSSIVLNEYTVSMITLSVITTYKPDDIINLLNLVLSILLLGVTLTVTFLKFKETAEEYKISYTNIILIEDELDNLSIRLQDNHYPSDPYEKFSEIKISYEKVLKETPNHKYIDYLKNEKRNSDLYWQQKLYYYSRIIFGEISFCIIFILPIGIIVYKLFV